MILEACVETLEEALKAQERGAHRIELCSRLDLDGLSPAPELVRACCTTLRIPVMVMIRPRAGGFVYARDEIRQMKYEIELVRELGAQGVVMGLLTNESHIDIKNTQRIAEWAQPLSVTFHKAIDLLADPVEGVRVLSDIPGVNRILTSGGKPTALEGVSVIRKMMQQAGERIQLVVAGKVTNLNVDEIAILTGSCEFHGRRIVGDLA
jgi:copper homeostasis protein